MNVSGENDRGEEKGSKSLETVWVPDKFKEPFIKAQDYVRRHFQNKIEIPRQGTIEISGERYILIRAVSMSYEFFNQIMHLYEDRSVEEARNVATGFLFDISHALGKADAKDFHKKLKVTDPIEKISAGPIHFAYSGWAFVDILKESNPTPDENYFLIYNHPFSFEADAWLKSGKSVDFPVCTMSSGYSSGWCEESVGMPLVAVEIECRARGDKQCRFIMAPPSKIERHIERCSPQFFKKAVKHSKITIPEFFQRKRLEEALQESEARYREIYNSNPIGMYRTTPDGRVLMANPAFCQMLGYSSFEELAKRNLEDEEYEPQYPRAVFKEQIEKKDFVSGFEAGWIKRNGERVFVREIAQAVRDEAGKIVYYEGTAEDITEHKLAENALRRSDAILGAVSFASEGFMRGRSWEDHIPKVILRLGKAAEVSRVYIFKNGVAEKGSIKTSQQFEWVASGIEPQIDNPSLQDLHYQSLGFGRWEEVLSTREMVVGNIREFPDEERQFLAPHGIYSLAVVPIFVGRHWWGFIGFDECTVERLWTSSEKDALKTAAGTLGAAIQRNQVMKELLGYRGHLEELVSERTFELKKLNLKLQKEIAERKQAEERITKSLKEKEVLLQEVYHRTKNNMQVIIALLTLQAKYIDDKKTIDIFEQTQNRIRSMALVHEKLYRSKNLTEIEMKEYIQDLTNFLMANHLLKDNGISLNLDVGRVILTIDTAIPCGLIINELVTNALKHAFPGQKAGEISIRLYAKGGNEIELYIKDNGVGMPENFDLKQTGSLGIMLVKNLIEKQLQGTLSLKTDEAGTDYHIRFPL